MLFRAPWTIGVMTVFAAGFAAVAEPAFEWEELPPLPASVGGQFAGTHGGVLISAGGTHWDGTPFSNGTKSWLDTVYVLEPGAEAWKTASPLPGPVAYGSCVSAPGGVVCIGGRNADKHLSSVFKLSWAGGEVRYSALPDLPRPCAYPAAALVGKTVYVAGGQESIDSEEALHTFWSLDLSDPEAQWQELDPWPGPARILAAAASQGGAFYLFSGADVTPRGEGLVPRTYLADAYQYAPDVPGVLAPGWKTISPPPQPVLGAPCAPFGPSHIFVFSGDDGCLLDQIEELGENHPGYTKDILAYHTITDTWAKFGEIPRSYLTTPAAVWQGRIVIPGGEDRPGVRGDVVLSGIPASIHKRLGLLDYGVMGVYFIVLLLMGFYFSEREKSTDDYFLGGRRVPWWAAGLSIYGTLLSAITFMSVPAASYAEDWRFYVGTVAMLALAPLVVYVYLPFFRRTNITTAYEYLEKRFNVAVRTFGSLAFILFQLGRVGIVILLPALTLAATTGIDVYLAILTMGILCTAYTYLGGIEAVIWTDVLQVIILLGGALLALILIVSAVDGGASAVIATGMEAGKFRLAHWGWDFTSQVFLVVLVGRALEAFIPYTTDQTVVQRYLTTADEKEARRAIWAGVLLSVPNSLIFFGLGTALYVFYKAHPQLLSPGLKTDAILPLFIIQQVPAGLAGLIVAAVFAAAMSSLDSSLNSVSAVVVTDFYRRFGRNVTEDSALALARAVTLLVGILGTVMALVFAEREIESLWQHYMKFIGLFGGGLAGLFILGIFTRRANGTGALIGAAAGGTALCYVQQTDLSFLLYSVTGITASVVIGYAASLFVGRNTKDLGGLTWWTRNP